MNMSISVNLPSFTIGPDAYDDIKKYAGFVGEKVAIIGGETALEKALPRLKPAIQAAGLSITTIEWYGGEASYSNIDRLVALDQVQAADMIFAVGGGRAIDTGKTVSAKLEKPIFTFPTIASNCAPTSANQRVHTGYMHRPYIHLPTQLLLLKHLSNTFGPESVTRFPKKWKYLFQLKDEN